LTAHPNTNPSKRTKIVPFGNPHRTASCRTTSARLQAIENRTEVAQKNAYKPHKKQMEPLKNLTKTDATPENLDVKDRIGDKNSAFRVLCTTIAKQTVTNRPAPFGSPCDQHAGAKIRQL